MSEAELLDHLCELAGIETSYWDLGGTLHHVPEKTKRHFAHAMGYRADSRGALKNSITILERHKWGEKLEPVYVLRCGSTHSISVAFSDANDIQNLSWRLKYENDLITEGSAVINQLEVEATHETDGQIFIRRRLSLPEDMPEGYHQLTLSIGDESASAQIIRTPAEAYLPEALSGRKVWGAAHQLYSLRSGGNWGIGDFSDLATLGGAVAAAGGAVLGLNPLHALFLSAPDQASPYAPSSRLFLNPLYIDVTSIIEFADCDAAQKLLATGVFSRGIKAAQTTETIDYKLITKIKLQILRLVYDGFESNAVKTRIDAFSEFIQKGGEKLHKFALFQALEAHFNVSAHDWPPAYQDTSSTETGKFAQQYASEIRFHTWLQWQARTQLDQAASHCRKQGLEIGLYGDLAVGVDASGAEAWDGGGVYVQDVQFGAPPDPFSTDGQNWGMPPLDPVKLRDAAYRPFIDILRANMRHAGALRIDHVMWLQRMFWIPQGAPTSEGAYIRYPVEDLFAILALESQRNACVVIGEDLGTVPEGFAGKMQAHGILSYRLMRFERYPDGLFKRPSTYPAHALAMFGSHDLPPIAGYWHGHDLDVLAGLGWLDEHARTRRQRDREMLVNALRDQQVWPDEESIESITLAIHRFLARSPCALMMVNLEDILQMAGQVNVPGTYLEHPNWRGRLNAGLEEVETRLVKLGPVLSQERGSSEAAK